MPFLGLCLGMQLAIVEFARDVLGYEDAHSVELKPDTTHPVIHLMPDQEGIDDIGGTLRLGSYPCVLAKDSKASSLHEEEYQLTHIAIMARKELHLRIWQSRDFYGTI